MKNLFLILTLLFAYSCMDKDMEEEFPMKLWLDGEVVDVEAEYQRITTFAEEIEYVGFDTTKTFVKKILVIHFQKEDSRVDLNKEHYAVIFTDWEGDTSNGLPIDEGSYQWPSVCPVCPRACMHGAPSKWVRMEIIGDSDVAVSGTFLKVSEGRPVTLSSKNRYRFLRKLLMILALVVVVVTDAIFFS